MSKQFTSLCFRSLDPFVSPCAPRNSPGDRTVFLCVLFLVFLLCPKSVFSQETTFQSNERYRAFGTVVDEDGKPIAGVDLVPSVFDPSMSKDEIERIRVKTDFNGNWQWDVSRYPKIYVLETRKFGTLPRPIPLDVFQKQETRLQLAQSVQGYVVDDQDREVEGALISSTEDSRYFSTTNVMTRSDNRGWFDFRGVAGNGAKLRVVMPSGETGFKDYGISNSTNVLLIELKKPTSLQLHFANASGEGLEDVDVSLECWEDSKAIEWSAKSNQQGNVIWSKAPIGRLVFKATKSGYHDAWIPVEVDGPRSQAIVLNPTSQFGSRVLDAETGAPIDRFMVVHNPENPESSAATYRALRQELVPWNLITSAPKNALFGTNGQFAIESIPRDEFKEVAIHAIGFESLRFKLDDKTDTKPLQEFRLRKPLPKRKDPAFVLNPNGESAAAANVLFVSHGLIPISKGLDPLVIFLSCPNPILQQSDSTGAFRLCARASHDFVAVWNDQGSYLGLVDDLVQGIKIQLEAYSTVEVPLSARMQNGPFNRFTVEQEILGLRGGSVARLMTELAPKPADLDTLISDRVPSKNAQKIWRSFSPFAARMHSVELERNDSVRRGPD